MRRQIAALVAVTLGALATDVVALSNSAKVPILTYHPHTVEGCTYETNDLIALATDLNTLHDQGFTVVPAYWIAEWVRRDRDGSTLPEKVVGLTFDDGADITWVDEVNCGASTSAKTVLANFKAAHPSLPWYSPHAAIFVIASQLARGHIGSAAGTTLSSSWWYAAQNSGFTEVYNHSTDHDHVSITSQEYDPFLLRYIPATGYADNKWYGENDFTRVTNYQSADAEVKQAAAFIAGMIGVWPDLFAYPFGPTDPYLQNTYFPNYWSEHQTYAAFCGDNNYATRDSPVYCIPRFVFRSGWSSSAAFQNILAGAP